MSINGKRDYFTLDELTAVGDSIGIRKPMEIIDEVFEAVGRWPEYAELAGVENNARNEIARYHRLWLDGKVA